MENFTRRWLYFGLCGYCGRRMLGEEGVRVTLGKNGANSYHHCCNASCAQNLARRIATSLRNAKIKSCANRECQGLIIGKGIWDVVDITQREEIFGPFCCPKCARKRREWLKKKRPNLLLAVKMRESMMSPAPPKR